jgi:PAS domain S-box-containing protein
MHFQPEWCRVTLASIGDAVITTDTEGQVTFLNPVAESLTGWTLEEATGVSLGAGVRPGKTSLPGTPSR